MRLAHRPPFIFSSYRRWSCSSKLWRIQSQSVLKVNSVKCVRPLCCARVMTAHRGPNSSWTSRFFVVNSVVRSRWLRQSESTDVLFGRGNLQKLSRRADSTTRRYERLRRHSCVSYLTIHYRGKIWPLDEETASIAATRLLSIPLSIIGIVNVSETLVFVAVLLNIELMYILIITGTWATPDRKYFLTRRR